MGHENWIQVRVNSISKLFLIRDLKLVLQKFELVERFKEGPLSQYLDLKQSLVVYGQLIHNLLKRETIHHNGQRPDEMWFGFGKSKARFGQEELCLCSGLNMGLLPEGFANNNKVQRDSMFRRFFKGKRSTVEVLYATLNKISSEESEDAYKMLNIYMVSQVFGMDDGRTTTISGWLFSLVENEEEFKKFPYGSYIFSFTLYFLKDVLNKCLPKLRGEEEKEDKKRKMKKINKVPSTIPELYDVMLESEQRTTAFYKVGFLKIRKKIKGGEEYDGFGDDDGKVDEEDVDVGDEDTALEVDKGDKQDDNVGDQDVTFEDGKSDAQEDGVSQIGKASKEGIGSDCVVVGDDAFESDMVEIHSITVFL
ncbi:hypothetical protein Ddye_030710 [Dipteronia dyeriana]|uniref:DUF1985 domain-containing protein n=1 Tax=Dipteronia dyeriana TaxID=168575 RepID=A0AAD9THX0_9ROSI|nr:hypothetical protein Ddye_030710 [Dipteronia dyeriana]